MFAQIILTLTHTSSKTTRTLSSLGALQQRENTYALHTQNPQIKHTHEQKKRAAGEISAYFRAINFQPEPTGELITFRGTMGRSRGQAAFLTFITFMRCLACWNVYACVCVRMCVCVCVCVCVCPRSPNSIFRCCPISDTPSISQKPPLPTLPRI